MVCIIGGLSFPVQDLGIVGSVNNQVGRVACGDWPLVHIDIAGGKRNGTGIGLDKDHIVRRVSRILVDHIRIGDVLVAGHELGSERIIRSHTTPVRYIDHSHRGGRVQYQLRGGGFHRELGEITHKRKILEKGFHGLVCHIIPLLVHRILPLNIFHGLGGGIVFPFGHDAVGKDETAPVGILRSGGIGGRAKRGIFVQPGKFVRSVGNDMDPEVLTVCQIHFGAERINRRGPVGSGRLETFHITVFFEEAGTTEYG